MVKGVAYTELGRYALDRVTAMGLDQSKFQLLAQEVTINIPTIRAKKKADGWKLSAPSFVTYDLEMLKGDSSIFAAASTTDEQIDVVRRAAQAFIEELEMFLSLIHI